MVKIPEAISLNSIDEDRKQQMSRQMIGRWSLQHALPSCTKSFQVETAQMRDLILNGSSGRCTTVAMYLRHHQAACFTQGHAFAQSNLGTLYLYGRGVTQDDTEAVTIDLTI